MVHHLNSCMHKRREKSITTRSLLQSYTRHERRKEIPPREAFSNRARSTRGETIPPREAFYNYARSTREEHNSATRAISKCKSFTMRERRDPPQESSTYARQSVEVYRGGSRDMSWIRVGRSIKRPGNYRRPSSSTGGKTIIVQPP